MGPVRMSYVRPQVPQRYGGVSWNGHQCFGGGPVDGGFGQMDNWFGISTAIATCPWWKARGAHLVEHRPSEWSRCWVRGLMASRHRMRWEQVDANLQSLRPLPRMWKRTSWVNCLLWLFSSIESKIRRVTPIMLSHEPPMWEECGTLKFQIVPECWRKFFIAGSPTCTELRFSSSTVPTKFVLQSERYSLTGPLSAWNHLMELMKDEADNSSTSSMWIARHPRHVNMTAQCLELAAPPRVRRVTTCHGPKRSTPTKVKGGLEISRSAGRSAIFWVENLARNFRYFTHLI